MMADVTPPLIVYLVRVHIELTISDQIHSTHPTRRSTLIPRNSLLSTPTGGIPTGGVFQFNVEYISRRIKTVNIAA